MTDYPDPPIRLDQVPEHLVDAWYEAWAHWGIVDALWYGEWPCCRELEPPRRPPSWYPGQPDPPRVRVARCACIYVRRYAPARLDGVRTSVLDHTLFLINEQCPHHGIDAYEIPEEIEGCSGYLTGPQADRLYDLLTSEDI
jgi:hypothetical protein